MPAYSIILKPSVEKDLRSLPNDMVTRIIKRIEALKEIPLPRQSMKLAGAENLYRLRIGEYRVVYSIDKEATEVIVHYVRHRRDAYRGL